MFSFFKKKDQDSPESGTHVSRPGEQPAAPAPAAEPPSFGNEGNGFSGIEVSNSESSLSGAEEQAVILHANGDCAGAIVALQGDLPRIKGQRHPETWLMLFELFQQTHDRAAFEALGLEFVVEFEKTPPIWREQSFQPKKEAPLPGNTCSFGSKLTAETAARELERFRAATSKIEPLRLDFGKVRELDSSATVELLAIWQLTKRFATPVQVLGAATFVKLISEKIQTGRNIPAEAPFWLLLMEVHQSLGQLEEFENLAIEYAITYEVSPPSWDPRLVPKTLPVKLAREEAATPSKPTGEGGSLALHGAITSQHSQSLAEIREYAARSGSKIVIDFEQVDRIDFESAGQLLNLFMACLQQGKNVHLVHVNELVLGLLRIMSVTELVTIERNRV
ncbi:Anti-anti-sigma regulatory factor (antagonist of anti-sigma factor) [Formivibrio citricus]|uniref:Anti-anti-sigma regulatory factor (Antagonist of anti-sigma factor) n=1 Tax=Formivibrio citricus TaxID=83765 RepID=A0A1I5DQG1_9NEIS|nr:STAS domain-containing protein [Formivibrio citricus]SFO01428.1 Anti-anti-sigma regulatory factor (antagonist of anti-sigma factor) [Formivibrio citricus]